MDKTKIANLKSQFDALSHLDSERGGRILECQRVNAFFRI